MFVAGAGGLWFWDAQKRLAIAERSSSEWQQIADELRGRLIEVDRKLEGVQDRQRAIDARLGETASSQRVLREELLGIGDRAALLEDALTRLAQTRQEGAQAMLLDEAEFLLLAGEGRLRLFRDQDAAIRALTLADAALAGLQEPIYATLRQTLAQEIAALQAMPADPLLLARARINALLAELATLPAPADTRPPDAPSQSRLAALLGQLITVRRLDESGAPLDPQIRAARLAAFGLQLQLQLAALERGEPVEGFAAGSSFQAGLISLFDRTDPRVAPHIEALGSLDLTPAAIPPAAGATLRELRGMRATRRLGQPPPALLLIEPTEPAAEPAADPAAEPEAVPGAAPTAAPIDQPPTPTVEAAPPVERE